MRACILHVPVAIVVPQVTELQGAHGELTHQLSAAEESLAAARKEAAERQQQLNVSLKAAQSSAAEEKQQRVEAAAALAVQKDQVGQWAARGQDPTAHSRGTFPPCIALLGCSVRPHPWSLLD